MTPADQARQIATRIRDIGREVVASFQAGNAADRIARVERIGNEIRFALLPVHGWIERHRTAEAAARLYLCVEGVLAEAVACAGMEVPEFAGGQPIRSTSPPSPGQDRVAQLRSFAEAVAVALLGCVAEMEADAQQAAATDDAAAYRPAKEFLGDHFSTYKRLTTALKKNPWIRTRRPRRNRLEIHAGDWHRLLAAMNEGGFHNIDELPASVQAGLAAEAQARAIGIRAKKAGE